MADRVVCLACGKIVDGRLDWRCTCPPPPRAPPVAPVAPPSVHRPASSVHRPASVAPPSRASGPASTPYRAAPEGGAKCPRCAGSLRDVDVGGSPALDCQRCGGVFLPNETVEELQDPSNDALRRSFVGEGEGTDGGARSVRTRTLDVEARYLPCPRCDGRMNRVNFARISGVLVDVCRNDGIWFDVGEVEAVVEFVESGGLERARERNAAERLAENTKLRAQWRAEHDAAERASFAGRRNPQFSPGEQDFVDRLVRWFRL